MNAPTDQTGSHPYTVHPDARRRDTVADAPTDVRPAVAAPRTVRRWVAGVIATATFVLGVGASMLVGPLGGPPSGGPGGAGGDPGTSQTTQQGTGQQGTGT